VLMNDIRDVTVITVVSEKYGHGDSAMNDEGPDASGPSCFRCTRCSRLLV